jgi:hypothetical protein
MKIVVVTKSLNEERNIENFCRGYDFADAILVADGGSTDRTVELAQKFANVKVRNFPLRIEMPDDPAGFMNPEPQHLNFCVDWAVEEKTDWIILDGCDCWPNPRLNRDARGIMSGTPEPIIFVRRLYIWGQDEFFTKISRPVSLWAWRPAEANIRSEEPVGAFTCFDTKMIGVEGPRMDLPPPYCCLHYFCPDEETVQMKLKRYAAWGYPQTHPRAAFGSRVKLPREMLE